MENNDEIINNIREIYRNADANKIHQLIANHFIPSQSEKKDNAEIPTAIPLVDEMLNIIPSNFWESPKKVFEPCCGKGNFIMKIFERFNNGLKKKYPDDIKRCQLIINECIYYADLTKMNVFITTEILKCEVEKVTKKNNVELKFNSHTGNTLELDIKKTFNIQLFDAVIANPPYQENGENSKSIGGTNLYTKFINKGFESLEENGYLIFINPISFLGPSTNVQMGGNILHNIFLKYDLLYLNLMECKKYFPTVGSTFCYYGIKKSITNNVITDVVSQYKKNTVSSKINFKKLSHYKFLPIHITKETIDLINKITSKENKLQIDRCRQLDTSNKSGKSHLKPEKDSVFKYITYHTTSKTYYSDIMLDIFDSTKILLNMAGYLKPEICKNCNITESKFYIKVNSTNEAKKIINFLESDDVKKYLEICKYSGFNSRPVLESISYNLKDLNSNDTISEDEESDSEEGSFSDLDEDENMDEKESDSEEGSFSDLDDSDSEEGSFSDLEDEKKEDEKIIITHKRKKYYLINNKIYEIKKDKSIGQLIGNYTNNKVLLNIV